MRSILVRGNDMMIFIDAAPQNICSVVAPGRGIMHPSIEQFFAFQIRVTPVMVLPIEPLKGLLCLVIRNLYYLDPSGKTFCKGNLRWWWFPNLDSVKYFSQKP